MGKLFAAVVPYSCIYYVIQFQMLPLVYRSPLRRTLLISAIRHNSSVPAKTRTSFASRLLIGFTGAVLGVGASGLSHPLIHPYLLAN